jgi:hypothetical protein
MSLTPPKDFSVEIYDNGEFLVVRANAHQFINLYHDEKIQAAEYLIRLKKALEQEGAMVLLVRSELGDDTK